MEKTCPEKKGNLPSWVHFRKRIWSLSDYLGALTRLTWLSEPKCLYGEKVGPEKLVQPGGRPYHHRHKRLTQPSRLTNFLSLANGSPPFGRKCIKRWFAQGSSARQVIILPGTAFERLQFDEKPNNSRKNSNGTVHPGKNFWQKKYIYLSRYYIFLVFTQTTEIFCTICLVNQF